MPSPDPQPTPELVARLRRTLRWKRAQARFADLTGESLMWVLSTDVGVKTSKNAVYRVALARAVLEHEGLAWPSLNDDGSEDVDVASFD